MNHRAEAGELDRAAATAERILSLDALNEPAHRLLMRVKLQAGHRSAAIQQAETCEAALTAAQIQPEVDTQRLLSEVRGPTSGPSAAAEPVPVDAAAGASSAEPAAAPTLDATRARDRGASIQITRRLSAILAADVVGYTRLMEQDEAGTFARLRAHRKELFEPEIARRHGRVFKLTGDGLLAEFGSVVDAVECAVLLQRKMAERNRGLPESERIDVRIGVHVGDVILDAEDRLGDAVNIAARLQQLAEPGGICVSRPVVDHVKRRVSIRFDSRGEVRLKNIAEPIAVYRVQIGGAVTTFRDRARPYLRPHWVAAAASAVLVIGTVAVWQGYFRSVATPNSTTTSAPEPTMAIARLPAVAVLPFENLSGDPAQDYFGAAMTEEIITALARYPDISVIARTSTEGYKDKPVDVRSIGDELGARYLLEGSVQRFGDKARIMAQLIDAKSGAHVWADRFDRESDNILQLQDQMAELIVSSLGGDTGEIRKRERALAWSKDPVSLDEYDYYLRGHEYFFRFTKEDNAKAREIWQEGPTKFPGSALLRIKLAFTYYIDASWAFTDYREESYKKAWEVGEPTFGAENAPLIAQLSIHWFKAHMYHEYKRDFEAAVKEAEVVVAMVPSEPFALNDMAWIVNKAGRLDLSIKWANEAIRRSPRPPEDYRWSLAWAYYLAEQSEDAVAEYERIISPSDDSYYLDRAAAYVRAGRLDAAKGDVSLYLQKQPGTTLTSYRANSYFSLPFKNPELIDAFFEDLRTAGLPEK
jgi:TolB-like protein/class 3 adenylate cyclase